MQMPAMYKTQTAQMKNNKRPLENLIAAITFMLTFGTSIPLSLPLIWYTWYTTCCEPLAGGGGIPGGSPDILDKIDINERNFEAVRVFKTNVGLLPYKDLWIA
jgi:hypothetical protein